MDHDGPEGYGDDGSAAGGASGGPAVGGPRRLTRSPDDRVFSGLSAGIAEYFGLDPLVVRIVWIVLAVITSGTALLVYALVAVIVPVGDPSPPGSRGQVAPPDPQANARLRSLLMFVLVGVAVVAVLPVVFALVLSLPLLALASVPLLFLAGIVWVLWLLLRPRP